MGGICLCNSAALACPDELALLSPAPMTVKMHHAAMPSMV
jgi:hypothetical protein